MARTGDPRLAAYLGYPEARQQLGDEGPLVPETFRSWISGLAQWGKPALVTASCSAARAALPVWETYVDPDPGLNGVFGQPWAGQSLEAAEEWLANRDEECLSKARDTVSAAQTFSEVLLLSIEEASGSAELCAARERAAAAALASLSAAKAAAWVGDDVRNWTLPGDGAEIEARKRAGPTLETVNAVCCAWEALMCSEQDMRTIIRGAFLDRLDAPQ
jgi:hypothetical protein